MRMTFDPSPAFRAKTVLLVLFGGLFGACDATGPSTPPKAPTVRVAKPIQAEVTDWHKVTGRVAATESVDVRPRVSGYITKVWVRDGEKVKAGDLLFQIDARSFQIDVQHAIADLERIRTQKALAETAVRRADRLRQSRAISEEEYDQRRQTLAESSESLRSAEANLMMAKLRLEWTDIRAPISGRIRRELLTVGNLVRGDETLLTTVISSDPAYVYLELDERTALELRRRFRQKGDAPLLVQLGLIDERDYPHLGTIDYFDPQFEAHTGTLTLRGVFPNEDEALSPGLFARVRLSASGPHPALLVPHLALAKDQDRTFLWVLKDEGQLKSVPVVTGQTHGRFIEIRSGISRDDEIVIDGLAKIRPGVRVRPEPLAVEFDG